MYFFKELKLENYRNFYNYEISFGSNCNIIIGSNGSGKTNLLESISLFEHGRGFRKDKLNNIINNKVTNKNFIINAKFIAGVNDLDLVLSSQFHSNKLKKKLLVNGNSSVESIKYFENLYSIIWFLPEMERIFLNNPASRRNFFDHLIQGIDKNYIKILNNYKKKIFERNRILKQHNYDENWINQVEKEIVDLGLIVYRKRIEHIQNLNSTLSTLENIKKNFFKFELKINDSFFNNFNVFENEIKSIFLLELKKSRKIDSILGGCKIGPHKTDIYGINTENTFSLAQCSTGEQKAIVLFIIIAQCKYLINFLNRKPIVLFDEVCSHIDENNRHLLLDLTNSLNVQIFMTGTEKNLFSFLSTKANYYNIS